MKKVVFAIISILIILSLVSAENCTQIGNRTAKMYCSSDYQLLPQKNATERCSTNYECLANDCVYSFCAKEKNTDANSMASWIFILIGLILIGLVILVFLRKPTY
jgi:hypothetical protein